VVNESGPFIIPTTWEKETEKIRLCDEDDAIRICSPYVNFVPYSFQLIRYHDNNKLTKTGIIFSGFITFILASFATIKISVLKLEA
jgi:hypothetical protein